MPNTRLFFISLLAMVAFAGNSLLCRVALASGEIDAASFTTIRLVSGAATLAALVSYRRKPRTVGGSWLSAFALFAYAAGFSFAYLDLSAATGALVLFGAVQATMIGVGIWSGERLNGLQILGVLAAVAGLVALLLPGVEAPPLSGALLMLGAGVAWGVYSLRGRGLGDPTHETAGNFIRAVPMAVVLSVLFYSSVEIAPLGALYAVASGALASGLGYAIWYMALPHLRATTAATIQLSVPALAAVGGVIVLSEPVTLRLAVCSIAILGGVGLFIASKRGTTSS
ncbi:DMT family transporter [Marinimicrobium sp. C6131]|uniref:DMT family transporter n=1 Tax=Marinimicrobium sp. C6131 TaxID=3022676 RepID=UPI00223D6D4F|nr:DMT family transporter [Marinimicrobium sp. C6131]UZJ44775.1 DMT family transporter [Marinimicrobium sp. C6131]